MGSEYDPRASANGWQSYPKPANFDAIPDDTAPENVPKSFSKIRGYEELGGFGEAQIVPPPSPPQKRSGEAPRMEFVDTVKLSKEECREALHSLVSQNCCWGSKPAKTMKITQIIPTMGLHYILETFSEERSAVYASAPYGGGPIDGPENGNPPAPWTVDVKPDTAFKDHTKATSVPHTASVMDCWCCDSRGWQRCSRCTGLGKVKCTRCNGKGRRNKRRTTSDGLETDTERCQSCNGSGRKKCGRCGGDGRATCSRCQGYSKVTCYIQLGVKFTNHKSNYILEETDLPDELVTKVKGIVLFQQIMEQVWPIMEYEVADVNVNSMKLCESHRTGFPSERQLQQRQTLRAVPVTEAHYTWNNARMKFWVYGLRRDVYHPDYPHQSCMGCSIL